MSDSNKKTKSYTLYPRTIKRLVKLAGQASVEGDETVSKSEVIDRLVEKEAKRQFGEDA